MARFYGTVQGGRGEASHLVHKNSGLRVSARSYSGDVNIELFVKLRRGLYLDRRLEPQWVHLEGHLPRPHR